MTFYGYRAPTPEQRAERLAWIQDRLAEDRWAQQRNKEIAVTRRKTQEDDYVDRFPETDAMRQRVAETRALLVTAFEQAEQAGDVNARIDKTDSAERGRFGVLGDESR